VAQPVEHGIPDSSQVGLHSTPVDMYAISAEQTAPVVVKSPSLPPQRYLVLWYFCNELSQNPVDANAPVRLVDGESHEFAEDDAESAVQMDQVHRQADNGSRSDGCLVLFLVILTNVDEHHVRIGQDVA